jgi:hypothetical protein
VWTAAAADEQLLFVADGKGGDRNVRQELRRTRLTVTSLLFANSMYKSVVQVGSGQIGFSPFFS